MGGYAMKGEGVQSVAKEDIPDVISVMATLTGIPESAFHPVGSTGKSDVSSDVDLAIDSTLYSAEDIHKGLAARFDDAATFNKGTQVGSYAVPVSMGIPRNNKRVQVDLMFTTSIEWAKFAYYSPNPHQSAYKGAVRTMLLMGVAAQINVEGVDYFGYDWRNPDEPLLTVRVGRTFDLNKGLRRIFQYRPERKDGKGYLKSLKTTTLDDIKQRFELVNVTDEDVVITKPNEALRLMFGAVVKPKRVNRAEDVIVLIEHSFEPDVIEQIYRKTADRAKSVKDKMKLPPEITRYL